MTGRVARLEHLAKTEPWHFFIHWHWENESWDEGTI